jgi:adenylate kinase
MSYVITGNPGVGKHTITKEIGKLLHLSIIDINSVAKEFGLFEKNKETNDVDVVKLGKIIADTISHPVLFVGHLAPYVLSTDKIKKVIVLRKNPYDLISVYKKREYSKEKIKDNLGSEALGVIFHDTIIQFGTEKTIQIDVTSQSIQETTKKVIDAIKGKIETEEVDWLTTITEKNDLREFFAH